MGGETDAKQELWKQTSAWITQGGDKVGHTRWIKQGGDTSTVAPEVRKRGSHKLKKEEKESLSGKTLSE